MTSNARIKGYIMRKYLLTAIDLRLLKRYEEYEQGTDDISYSEMSGVLLDMKESSDSFFSRLSEKNGQFDLLPFISYTCKLVRTSLDFKELNALIDQSIKDDDQNITTYSTIEYCLVEVQNGIVNSYDQVRKQQYQHFIDAD